jgi:hypothetical protein
MFRPLKRFQDPHLLGKTVRDAFYSRDCLAIALIEIEVVRRIRRRRRAAQ